MLYGVIRVDSLEIRRCSDIGRHRLVAGTRRSRKGGRIDNMNVAINHGQLFRIGNRAAHGQIGSF